MMINQLNYLNMMIETVALQVCVDDDFIFENYDFQKGQKLLKLHIGKS